MSYPLSQQFGFTLVEILIAISILALVAVAGIPNLRKFSNDEQVKSASTDLVRTLKQAQVSAMAGTKCPNQGASDLVDAWFVNINSLSYQLVCQSLQGGLVPNPETIKTASLDPIDSQIILNYTDCKDATVDPNAQARIIFTRNQIIFDCIPTTPPIIVLNNSPFNRTAFKIYLKNSTGIALPTPITVDVGGAIYQ